MDWKRAKNILIILFIFVDLFLLFINIFDNYGKNKVEYEELNRILKENNIILPKDIIKKNTNKTFTYEYIFYELNDDIKKELLGEYTQSSDKEFISRLIHITVPIAFQNLMLASVAAADAMMLGFLNQNSLYI